MEEIRKFAKRTSLCRIHSWGRGITNVHVEIAATPSAIQDGLMHRTYLPYDSGMVFLFQRPTGTSFWMRNTYIPLSIAFWNADDTIIAIMDMEPRDRPPYPSYAPSEEYVGALEVNQGFFEEHGVEVGDKVEIIEMGGRTASSQEKITFDMHPAIRASHEEIRSTLGGRDYMVGGAVRDKLMGKELKSHDDDYALTGIDDFEKVRKIYEKHGCSFAVVGNDFPVAKVTPPSTDDNPNPETIDVALARTESKSGPGYKGFKTQTGSHITIEDDLRRRDCTMNSIAVDMQTGEKIDPFGGEEDIKNGIIRHTDDETFGDDPVRALRVARLAAQHNMTVHPDTISLCQSMAHTANELTPERIGNEVLTSAASDHPEKFFDTIHEMGWLPHIAPHLHALGEVEQDKVYHPEGNGREHSIQTLAESGRRCVEQGITGRQRIIDNLSAVFHDIGKATNTQHVEQPDGSIKITSEGHAKAGADMVHDALSHIGINDTDIHLGVSTNIEHHMDWLNYNQESMPQARRHAAKVEAQSKGHANMSSLTRLAENDQLARRFGRTGPYPEIPEKIGNMKRSVELANVSERKMEPILKYEQVKVHGIAPGPEVGRILRDAAEAQTEGAFSDLTGGQKWLEGYMSTYKPQVTSSWKRVIVV